MKTKQTNKILGSILLIIIMISFFSIGIWMNVQEIGGDTGFYISLISTPLLSQSIGLPFKYGFMKKNKNIANDIRQTQIDHNTRNKIKKIIDSNDVASNKLSDIRKEL